VTDAFAAKVVEIEHRNTQQRARRGMWLAHHWPDHYARCVVIAGRHVCRRCLVLYPVTFAVAFAAVAGLLLWPRSLDPELIWLLSIPGTLEYAAEQLGVLQYRARRQIVATALTAIPLGRGMSYEFEHRWSLYFWGPLLVFGTIWFATTIIGRRTRSRSQLQ
jgi:hypothetical protein